MVARNLEDRNLQSIRVHHSAAANTVRDVVGYAICLFAFLVASLCSVPLHVAVTKISERREDRARLIGRYVNYFFHNDHLALVHSPDPLLSLPHGVLLRSTLMRIT